MDRLIKGDTLAQIAAYDATQKVRLSAIFGIWLLVSLILLIISMPGIIAARFPDPDDLLRLLQVRDWLAGQDWYDVRQYRMNAPDGAPMHWSRLVDIPIAIVITLLTPLMGASRAEMAAIIIIPALTLFCVMWLAATLTNRLGTNHMGANRQGTGKSGLEAAYLACFVIVMIVPVAHQLRPMRIDHHGWQIIMALLALSGFLDARPQRGAIVTGGALALWLSISMEGLPMAAAFMGGFAILWLCSNAHRHLLVMAMAALTGTSGILFAATRIFASDSWTQYCDAISPVHIGVFALGTGMLAILARLNPEPRAALLAGLGLTGSSALALFYGAAPQCTNGAFGQLDPLVYNFWYLRVNEGLPLWHQPFVQIIQNLAVPVIAVFTLLIHWLRFNRQSDQSRGVTLAAYAQTLQGRTAMMLCCALAISFMVERAAAVSCMIALPITANMLMILLKKVRSLGSPFARIGGTLGVFAMAVPGLIVAPASALISTKAQDADKGRALIQDASTCQQYAQLQLIQELPAGNIMTPLELGPYILYASDHKVVASSHHRNDAAIHDVLSFFTGSAAQARKIVTQRGIDYIIYCENIAEPIIYANQAPQGVMARLRKGDAPSWLKRETLYGADKGLRVWRVKR